MYMVNENGKFSLSCVKCVSTQILRVKKDVKSSLYHIIYGFHHLTHQKKKNHRKGERKSMFLNFSETKSKFTHIV